MTKCYFRVLFENCSFDPRTDTTMPEYEYSFQQTLDLCRNRYFRVLMENVFFYPENVPLTWHKQTNKPIFYFFRMTLPSVEGIAADIHSAIEFVKYFNLF